MHPTLHLRDLWLVRGTLDHKADSILDMVKVTETVILEQPRWGRAAYRPCMSLNYWGPIPRSPFYWRTRPY